MVKSIDIEEFLKLAACEPVVDVRSPAEYSHGRIPGAVSLPLFDNEERAEIGTLYKQNSRQAAMKRGLEIVGPKMREMVETAEKLPFSNSLLLHCWRGGMRSGSVAWLLHTYGVPVATLQGGYKSFRNHALDFMQRPMNLRIVTGPTGSGKTDLIAALARAGCQVVDLEALACHKGSVFGGLGQATPQPSSEQFQNELFWKLKDFDLTRPIWLEDESIGIGKVMIPDPLWKQMGQAGRVYLNMSKQIRISRLVREYGAFSRESLQQKILQLEKKLGGQHLKEALQALAEGDLEQVAATLLVYYDKAYNNALLRHKNDVLLTIAATHENFDEWAGYLTENT